MFSEGIEGDSGMKWVKKKFELHRMLEVQE